MKEPMVRVELTTARLRIECFSTELHRLTARCCKSFPERSLTTRAHSVRFASRAHTTAYGRAVPDSELTTASFIADTRNRGFRSVARGRSTNNVLNPDAQAKKSLRDVFLNRSSRAPDDVLRGTFGAAR